MLRDLLPFKDIQGLCAACPTSLLYVSETWPSLTDGEDRLDRNEMSMIRWMCGPSSKDQSSKELRSKMNIAQITVLVRMAGCDDLGTFLWRKVIGEDSKTKRLKPRQA